MSEDKAKISLAVGVPIMCRKLDDVTRSLALSRVDVGYINTLNDISHFLRVLAFENDGMDLVSFESNLDRVNKRISGLLSIDRVLDGIDKDVILEYLKYNLGLTIKEEENQ